MLIKAVKTERYQDYKYPCMFIACHSCSFKCEKECGIKCCQNNTLIKAPNLEVDTERVIELYTNNPITQAICCQGLEPFDSWSDLLELISLLRKKTLDDIVIYTGYYENEIQSYIDRLKADFKNIVIKFGRYIPNQQPHYDKVLGVYLASDNQKGVRIC